MSTVSTPAIRLSVTKDVQKALDIAKRAYPTLSYAEILKLGLSKIVTDAPTADRDRINQSAAYSVGYDYLKDSREDIYNESMGQKVNFS